MASPADRPDLEQIAELLVRSAPPGHPSEPCPDANLLAAMAEGRLAGDEREAVLVHAAACESCRSIAAALAEGEDEPASAAAPKQMRRSTRRYWLPIAAAALALIAGASIRAALAPGPASVRERLLAAAAELARRRPDLFAGFEPFGAVGPAAPQLRGGPVLLHPAPPPAKVLGSRLAFRWEPVAGAEYSVALSTADGRPMWRADCAEAQLEYPAEEAALEPGSRYLWSVAARGPVGLEGSRAFDVATSAEALAFERALEHLAVHAPAELVDLLAAHLALDRGYLLQAEHAARRARELHPDDATARATLNLVLERLGSTERTP